MHAIDVVRLRQEILSMLDEEPDAGGADAHADEGNDAQSAGDGAPCGYAPVRARRL